MYNQTEPYLSPIDYDMDRNVLFLSELAEYIEPTITTRSAYEKTILETEDRKGVLETNLN